MATLAPTANPIRPFLDWPVVTDPSGWSADVALLGIQHSEPKMPPASDARIAFGEIGPIGGGGSTAVPSSMRI